MPLAGSLSPLALQKVRGANSQPFHARADLRPLFLQEPVALALAKARAGPGGDEHADSALHDDEAFVLKTLVGLGNRKWVRLLICRKGSDGRKGVAVAVFPGKNRVRDRLPEAD